MSLAGGLPGGWRDVERPSGTLFDLVEFGVSDGIDHAYILPADGRRWALRLEPHDSVRQTCLMCTVVDLDVAVREIERRAEGWRAGGFAVGPVTWRDQGGGWPPSLKTERDAVADPDSIGVEVRLGVQEGSVVLFKGAGATWRTGPAAHRTNQSLRPRDTPMTSPSRGSDTCSIASSTFSINHGLADNVMQHCRFGSRVSRSAVSGQKRKSKSRCGKLAPCPQLRVGECVVRFVLARRGWLAA